MTVYIRALVTVKNCFRNYGTPHRSSTVSPGIIQNGGAETGGVGLGPYNKVAVALRVNIDSHITVCE
jgi:hypothetical protein